MRTHHFGNISRLFFCVVLVCLFHCVANHGGLCAQETKQNQKIAKVEITLDKKVSLKFSETPLIEVLERLLTSLPKENKLDPIPFTIAPCVKQKVESIKVEFDVSDLPTKNILNFLLEMYDLVYTVKDGCISITSKYDPLTRSWTKPQKIIPYLPTKKDKAILKRLKEEKVTMDFECPLNEIVDFLRTFSGMDIILNPIVYRQFTPDQLNFDITVHDLSMESLLNLLTSSKNLSYKIQDGMVVIYKKTIAAKYPIEDILEQKSMAPQDLIALIKKECSPETWEQKEHGIIIENDTLAISQMPEVISQIEWLLGIIRFDMEAEKSNSEKIKK